MSSERRVDTALIALKMPSDSVSGDVMSTGL
jgi:hypothetical protein